MKYYPPFFLGELNDMSEFGVGPNGENNFESSENPFHLMDKEISLDKGVNIVVLSLIDNASNEIIYTYSKKNDKFKLESVCAK